MRCQHTQSQKSLDHNDVKLWHRAHSVERLGKDCCLGGILWLPAACPPRPFAALAHGLLTRGMVDQPSRVANSFPLGVLTQPRNSPTHCRSSRRTPQRWRRRTIVCSNNDALERLREKRTHEWLSRYLGVLHEGFFGCVFFLPTTLCPVALLELPARVGSSTFPERNDLTEHAVEFRSRLFDGWIQWGPAAMNSPKHAFFRRQGAQFRTRVSLSWFPIFISL